MPDFPDPKDPQDYTEENDDLKHQASKPPSVLGEEDAFSDDTPAESPDIDEELGKVGLPSDENGPKPLGSNEEVTQ